MQTLGYLAAAALAGLINALPLRWVAAIGRLGGAAAWFLDRSHRRVTLLNLSRCFPAKSERERQAIAREHFRRLGENYTSAVKTAGMHASALQQHVEVTGFDRIDVKRGAVVAIGHFGNFELYSRLPRREGIQLATTYRGMKNPKVERLVKELRENSGCVYFERRQDGQALRQALRRGRIVLGLLCDQHAGSRALKLPFLGHECAVNVAPAVFALRYQLPLYTGICYRVGPARWRIEFGDEIPTRTMTPIDGDGSRRRTVAEIMADVHLAFERAVRRDPANWFWVHDRWRFAKAARTAQGQSLTPNSALRNPGPAKGSAGSRS